MGFLDRCLTALPQLCWLWAQCCWFSDGSGHELWPWPWCPGTTRSILEPVSQRTLFLALASWGLQNKKHWKHQSVEDPKMNTMALTLNAAYPTPSLLWAHWMINGPKVRGVSFSKAHQREELCLVKGQSGGSRRLFYRLKRVPFIHDWILKATVTYTMVTFNVYSKLLHMHAYHEGKQGPKSWAPTLGSVHVSYSTRYESSLWVRWRGRK